MKIYIMTDLEGAAMVSRWRQVVAGDKGDPEMKRQAMTLLTGEVNAAVDGILEADPAAEIIVCDGHGNGGVDIMSFHPKAKLLYGGNRPPFGLDETFDAYFFVGQHAMAGVPGATLPHTYSADSIEYYKLNGRFVGEFGARAMMAGTFGVPTVFVSGDDKAIAEARDLVPGIHGAVVKQGLGEELELHLSPPAAREVVRRVAREAARDIPNILPVQVTPPYTQEIRVYEGFRIKGYLDRGAEQIDERTVLFKSDNICDLLI
jgi:D-amino peptidase